MYFSKNSRYVFQRAHWLTPSSYFLTHLKLQDKQLSVKFPKEDPSKPPLRMNIPKEAQPTQPSYSKFIRNPTSGKQKNFEPRSRSLMSRTSTSALGPSYEEDYLPKCESEIQFSTFGDDVTCESNFRVDGSAHEPFYQAAPKAENSTTSGAEKSEKQNVSTNSSVQSNPPSTEKSSEMELASNPMEDNAVLKAEDVEQTIENKLETKSQEKALEKQNEEESDPKTLYIIIDVPEKNEDKFAHVDTAEPFKEGRKIVPPPFYEDDFSTIKSLTGKSKPSKIPKAKSDWQKSVSPAFNTPYKAKSKSLNTYIGNKAKEAQDTWKPNANTRFEVHEIEDAATYIFHLRFKRHLQGRPSSVGWVPEKEVNTRSGSMKPNESHIRVRDSTLRRSFKALGTDVAPFDDFSELARYSEAKNTHQKHSSKSENYEDKVKTNVYAAARNYHNSSAVSKTKAETQKKEEKKLETKPEEEISQQEPQSHETYLQPSSYHHHHQQQQSSRSENLETMKQEENWGTTNQKDNWETTKLKEKWGMVREEEVEGLMKQEENWKTAKQSENSEMVKKEEVELETKIKGENWGATKQEDSWSGSYSSKNQTMSKESKKDALDGDRNSKMEPEAKTDESYYQENIPEQKAMNLSQNIQPENVESPQPQNKKIIPENLWKFQEKKSQEQSLTERRKFFKKNKGSGVDKKRKKSGKFTESHFHSDSKITQNKNDAKLEKIESDITDFKPSASAIKITSEPATYPMNCGAAFPPTLSEAIRGRGKKLGFKRETLFNTKWGVKFDFGPKDFEMNPKCLRTSSVAELSENSILFPKKPNKNFNCDALFKKDAKMTKDVILNVAKIRHDENSPKISDNIANVANENLTETKGTVDVDSLTMMKNVKKILDLDLKNAIKIFDGRNSEPMEKTSSVVTTNGENWKVDVKELEKYVETQEKQTIKEINLATSEFDEGAGYEKIATDGNLSNFKTGNNVNLPKYLPSKKIKENPMKLDDQTDSVITFNPDSNEFQINREELQDVISRKIEPISSVVERLEQILKEEKLTDSVIMLNEGTNSLEKYQMKRGDSILVFDEETQTWKVDYSILEKKEESLRQERELTRRSELILETFEKLEQGKVSNIPKPDSRERKIFDYNTEEWKVYHPEKKTQPKSAKTKLPVKESNAEEIRKKNSDLYDNLFVGKKKESQMSKSGKESSGTEKKEAKAYNSGHKKEAKTGEPTKNSEPPTKEPHSPGSGTPAREPKVEKYEDDNFWDSFLKMNILPRPVSEINKIKVPPTPQAPPTPPSPPSHDRMKKIEEPKPTKTPPKKIEEPKFRLSIPFRGDKKTDDHAIKTPRNPLGGYKHDPFKKKPPPSTSAFKKEETKIKAPPPSGAEKKEEPKMKMPPANTTHPKNDPKSKPPPTIGSPKPTSSGDSPLGGSRAGEGHKVKEPSSPTGMKVMENSNSAVGKKDKSSSDHYISENIVEMSRSSTKDKNSKFKTNKIETVKVNISPDKRLPSKITEINLNKKCEEKFKDLKKGDPKKILDGTPKKIDKCSIENKSFYRNFEKYKTPFSDPEYEEKSMKIKSDIESNPNLKKLDNWNKTLVLHEIVKPPDNIESWLKDETDKMATLLLKVLQEAADGKPKKKPPLGKSKSYEKGMNKSNPYDSIRKKQEKIPDSFVFKVQSVNIALDNAKKKSSDETILSKKSEKTLKDIPVQSAKTIKPLRVIDAVKLPAEPEKDSVQFYRGAGNLKSSLTRVNNMLEEVKPHVPEVPYGAFDSVSVSRELFQQSKTTELTDEIPGPEILKKISKAWKLFPLIGCQMTVFTLLRIFQLVNKGTSLVNTSNSDKTRRNTFSKLFAKYGPIVNVQGPLSGNVILIHKPEHLSGVFDQDVTTSVRSVFDSLEQSRKETEEKVRPTGISTDWSKSEWSNLKKTLNDPLLKGCENFFGAAEQAGESLISNIRRNRNGQNHVSDDFMDEIRRWSMEGMCNILFEKSFNFLEGRSNHSTWLLEPDKLYMAIDEATEYLSKCERGFQTWRLMATPSYIGLGEAYRTLSTILSKHLYQAEVNLRNKNGLLKDGCLSNCRDMTFVESMLLNDGMTIDEVTCNLVDILLIGVNVMSSALGFLLYNLAQNEKVQNKLLKEVKESLPEKNSRLDYHKLHSLKYLQACLKESLRLHVPIPIFFRLLQNDVLLSNYIVPKGTYVVMDSKVSCMKEQIFDEPDKFVPQRWLNEENWMQGQHPFASFPFCYGPRADLAKRIVEMQLWSCVAKMIRNFKVEYHYGEIQGTDSLMSFPDKPLKFNFIERNE